VERIPILTAAGVEGALRRYITANALFESTCTCLLEREDEDEDEDVRRLMEMADSGFWAAGNALEEVLQRIVAERVDETLRLAGLMSAPIALCER
jgi:hypothetical protein